MKTRILIFGIMLGALMACSKDDGPQPRQPDPIQQPDSEPENRPPGDFTLLTVADKEMNIDLLPTFTWSTSTDPDGDAVTYDVYLDQNANPTTKVATDLNTATFTLAEKLDMAREYHWKVTANDGKGKETSSTTFIFKTRPARVTKIQTTKPFDERLYHTSVVYQDKMWVIGGSNKNDVWTSTDGIVWDLVKPDNDSGFSKRRLLAAMVYKDIMGNDGIYVFGGIDETNAYKNDVWRSTDGADWDNVFQISTRYTAVGGHSVVSFKDRTWILGGSTEMGDTSDIWSTSVPTVWGLIPTSTVFEPRRRFASLTFKDSLWVIGGFSGSGSGLTNFDDIWKSEDGKEWVKVGEHTDFGYRQSHTAVVFEDKMWIIGGVKEGDRTNEIWYSSDGETWINATPEDSFVPVSGHTSLVFQDKIWILGGGTAEEDNLVWTIE